MTPIRRPYLAVKRRFPVTIVLFRLGDFYKTFDQEERAADDADQVPGKMIGDEQAPVSQTVLERWRLYKPACYAIRMSALARLLRTKATADSLWPQLLGRG